MNHVQTASVISPKLGHLGLLIIVPISKKEVKRAFTLGLVGLNGVKE